MARIRTIKPEFPQSESMGRVSRDARLLFIMLWTIADDDGRLRGNSRMLASLLYPYDEDAGRLIGGWLAELSGEGCIDCYQVGGDSYLSIRNWLNHQRIDKPSKSKIPAFEESSQILANPREPSCEDQRKGSEEGNGKDQAHSVEPALDLVGGEAKKPAGQPTPAEQVFAHWQTALGHPQAHMSDERQKLISKALGWGYSIDQLKQAINGCALTPHNIGQNDRGQRYDGLNVILRNGDQIDRFIANAISPPRASAGKPSKHDLSTMDYSKGVTPDGRF